MMFMKGFLLGIASGGVCLAYCAPVLVPYLLGEGKTARGNVASIGTFLGGRLAGYLLFAVLAWATHFAVVKHLPYQRTVGGSVTIGLALLLIVYGFAGSGQRCNAIPATAGVPCLPSRGRAWLPRACAGVSMAPGAAMLGFLTGVNVCPPFLLAFSDAAQFPRLGQSLLFFTAFFLGTSAYLAPLPLVGMVGRRESVRTIGRLAAGIVGLFYLYSGIVNVAAGMR